MAPQRIAVVGTGIAGMASAWCLSRHHTISVYEARPRIGGHTNTVVVDDPQGPTPVDTGFIVYNEVNYPHLTALFRHLGVATQDGEMSFAVSVDEGRLEYSGSNLNGLFGQRRNLARPGFHRMLVDILRFNRAARRLARNGGDAHESLGEFLARLGLGRALSERYLLPMAAAIWSCPPQAMLEFPALSLARFYDNHGLLNIQDRPQWRTVTGGSRQYVEAITRPYAAAIRTGVPVARVEPVSGGVRVTDAGGHADLFDQVVIAAHADEAFRMLPHGDPRHALLAGFSYQDNRAVLHRDEALMPRRRRIWSAWNYLSSSGPDGGEVSVTYWMNRLQRLERERQYFVSLNPVREPAPERVVAEFSYQHPVFDATAMAAQQRLPALNGQDGIWLAGSYLGFGFHEDALRSAVEVAQGLGAAAPWSGSAPGAPQRPAAVPAFAPAVPVADAVGRSA